MVLSLQIQGSWATTIVIHTNLCWALPYFQLTHQTWSKCLGGMVLMIERQQIKDVVEMENL